jgi:hypothetical protein
VTARASVGKRRWDEVSSIRDDGISLDDRDWLPREGRRALSRTGIAEQNRLLLRRYRDFRLAADAVVASWRHRAEVVAVALLGSVAARPWQEVPRFAPFRRARIALWHECKDLDLAVWLAHLRGLDGLRRAKDRALRDQFARTGAGVAPHQVDVFVLEPGTGRYLGRLCQFNRCPKGKPECLVTGCGAAAFLRQHDAFRWQPQALAEDRAVRLFDRDTGQIRRAADLPLPDES